MSDDKYGDKFPKAENVYSESDARWNQAEVKGLFFEEFGEELLPKFQAEVRKLAARWGLKATVTAQVTFD